MATGGKDKMLLIKVAGAGLALLVAIVLLLQYTGAIGGGPSTPVPTAEQKAANERTLADSQAYLLEQTLGPIRSLDWRVLQALSTSKMDPAALIAVAFRELAENATKIGELNMSPDLLRSLMQPPALPNGK